MIADFHYALNNLVAKINSAGVMQSEGSEIVNELVYRAQAELQLLLVAADDKIDGANF